MRTLLIAIFLTLPATAQIGPAVSSGFIPVVSDPTGSACQSNSVALRTPNGQIYTCVSGVYALAASGGSSGTVTSVATSKCITGGPITATGTISLATVTNAQSATYQAIAADFSSCKTIIVASGTFTITLVSSASQPADGTHVNVINYGSGVVTISRSGQNINGGTASLTLASGSATAPTSATIWSDGVNYFSSISGSGTNPTTATSCTSAASPAVCASAAAGFIAFPTGVTSVALTVNTTAVTATSKIFIFSNDTLGTALSVTCNSTLATLVGGIAITAKTAGTSFEATYSGTIATNPLCANFLIVN